MSVQAPFFRPYTISNATHLQDPTKDEINSESFNDSGHQLYLGYHFLAKIGRFAGLFPKSNIGTSQLRENGLLEGNKTNRTCILSILSLLIMAADLAQSLNRARLNPATRLDKVATMFFENATRLGGILVLAIVSARGQQFNEYFRKWDGFGSGLLKQNEGQKSLTDHCKKLALFLAISTTVCLGLTAMYVIHTSEPVSTLDYVSCLTRTLPYAMSLFYLLFIVCNAAYFALALRRAFASLSDNVKVILGQATVVASGVAVTDASQQQLVRRLQSLRHHFQRVDDLAEGASALLSPLLAFIIVAFSVSCSTLLYMIVSDLARRESMLVQIRIFGSLALRGTPIMLICYVGEKVSSQSMTGLKYIYNSTLTSLSSDIQFQVKLLEYKLLFRTAQLSASGIVQINYNLFLQIVGVVVTYVIILVQFPGS